jgi:hypothetical protein
LTQNAPNATETISGVRQDHLLAALAKMMNKNAQMATMFQTAQMQTAAAQQARLSSVHAKVRTMKTRTVHAFSLNLSLSHTHHSPTNSFLNKKHF